VIFILLYFLIQNITMLKCIISLKKFQTKLFRKNFKFTVIFILKKPLSFWLLLCPKKKKKKKAIIFLPSIHRSLIKWFDTWIYYSHIITTRHDTTRTYEIKRENVVPFIYGWTSRHANWTCAF